MKCPCCGEDTDKPFIIVHNVLHKADGTRLMVRPGVLRMLLRLLVQPVALPEKPYLRRAFKETTRQLREFITTNNLPYTLVLDSGMYFLRSNRS